MQDFTKLRVWTDAQAVDVYRATDAFPQSERYGLVAQMRRAAVSVSSNIAEGCGRNGPRDMSRFLQIAVASTCELLSQLDLAARLGFIPVTTRELLSNQSDLVRRMLIRLRDSVEQHATSDL